MAVITGPQPSPSREGLAPPRSFLGTRNAGDRVFRGLCQLACVAILTAVGLLIVVLVVESMPAVDGVGYGFVTTKKWDPRNNLFGSLSFVYGTVVTSALAMLIAVPLGV